MFEKLRTGLENPLTRIRRDIETLDTKRPIYGPVELVLDKILLRLKRFSLSYLLNYSYPKTNYVVDIYCLIQFILLSLTSYYADNWFAFIVVTYIVFEIYLYLFNIVFLGKYRDINEPPSSVERSIILLLLNVIDVVLAFAFFYRYCLGIPRRDAFYGAVLVLGTIGTPISDPMKMPAVGRILVALQVFLDLFLIIVILGSFIGKIGLFSGDKNGDAAPHK